jgi:glycolate oxidase iron-sulfur subunit
MNKHGKTLSLDDLLQLVQEEAHKCIRCGECRTVCPVFKENFNERYTARGKILIAEELAKGNLEFTGHVREAFDNCLLCTGCVSQCSSGARADKVVMAVRQVFADKKGLNPVKKIIGRALSQPGKVLDVEARIGAYVQPLLFKGVPEDSGMHLRFAMSMIDKTQYVPTVAKKSFRDSYSPSKLANNQGRKKKVIFFTGCMSNYAMTEIAESTVKFLNAVGVSVEVPTSQGCCGMPMLASGDFAHAGKQMERNLKALLTGYDKDVPIVTACASCGHMLKHGYKELIGRYPGMAEKIQNLADRSRDITEYLLEDVGEDKLRLILGDHFPETVTYHDPCHLRKAQGISKEPRTLLEIIPGINFKEMESPESCCGMGGTYCITNMEISKSIQAKKIEDVNNTNADCVSTACPGCILQLRDGLRRSGQRGTSVKHVIQLLAESL